MIERRKPRLLFPALMAILVVVLAVWLFYTITTGNPLWFQYSRERVYAPDRIVVHYYGTTTELQPGSEAFREVEAALNQSLSTFRGRIPVGLSEETLRDYREKEYAQPVIAALNNLGYMVQ